MYRQLIVCLALLLVATAGVAQEILLPIPQAPPEHNVARFSDLIETDVASVPSVVPEHGGRRASNVREGAIAALSASPSIRTGASRASRGTVPSLTSAFTIPVTIANFQGLGDSGNSIPPDTTGAVGPQHVMVTLNTQVQIEDRFGNVISTKGLSTFWNPLGSFSILFDPRVFYDPYGKRWVAAVLANANSTSSSILLAVSATDDPTGVWNYYKFSGDPNPSGPKQYWADYTNLGFNKNWIVISVNLIPLGGNTTNDARMLVISKADAYAGVVNPTVAPFLINNSNSLVPAYTYDASLDTMYIAEEWDNTTGQLRLSTVTGPVGTETLSTGTAFVSSNSSWAQTSLNADFAPQQGDTRKISAGDSRLQNLIYRNADLWASQTSFLPAGSNPTRSLIQWWQMTPSGTLKQFVRIDDPTAQTFYAFPGMAINKDNFVILGFSQFAFNIYASAAYSLQAPGTVNQMTVAPQIFKAGTGPYNKDFGTGENRWGDFSLSVVDPVDDTDLWTLQEYSATITAPSSLFGVWWLHIFPGDGTIAAKPASFDYGLRALQSTTTQQITVANSSASTVTINSIDLTGPGASSYSQTNNCPASLVSGAVCNVTVTFKPASAGTLSAFLVVNSSGTPSLLQVPLTGSGQDSGPPDAFPGLILSWATPVSVGTSSLTADASDPLPSCQGNLVSANQSATTAWFQYFPDADGALSYSATSSADFVLSVWNPSRRTGLHEVACARAQFANGVFSVTNLSLPIARLGYYFMFSVAPGTTIPINFNLPGTGSPAALSAIISGLQFFPGSFNTTAVQALAITNPTTTTQAIGISSTNPAFTINFIPGVQCSPSILADTTCLATITYMPAGAQPALPHTNGTLSLTGNVSPTSSNLQGILPTDLTPYSAAYARTVDALPFTDTKLVPVIPASDNTTCFALKAPLFYTFSPTVSGTINVNLANFVVAVSGSDASSVCYSQFGAGTDTGFAVTAGVTYSLEIGTDARATVPVSQTVTLTGTGSVFSLSPTPVFFGRFSLGGNSAPVTMTLTNGSTSAMPVTFSGAPFTISNSTCGANLPANSSCTFDLTMSSPVPPGGAFPFTSTFIAGKAKAAVSWISPPMTLLPSATLLQFLPQQSGYTSGTRKLILLMQDNVGPLQIQTTGDFAQTNDCAQASYTRPYCTVSVTFTPSATGARSGSLSIDYNLNPPLGLSAGNRTIPLSGSGLSADNIRPVRSPRASSTEVIHPTSSRSARSSVKKIGPYPKAKTAPFNFNKQTRETNRGKTSPARSVN